MDNKFVLLDCDDDVVLFEKDTFKVGRLRELTRREVRRKLDNVIYDSKTHQQRGEGLTSLLSYISVGEESINFSHFQYNSVKDCQLLQLSSIKGWQKGKLKIQIHIYVKNQPDKVCLEFYPDEPMEAESPLDELRKQIQTI